MATVINTLYPPSMPSYMPAFIYDEDAVINFSITPYNSIKDIKYLHISIVDQRTNKNVLFGYSDSTMVYPDILPIDFVNDTTYLSYNSSTNVYSLRIPRKILRPNGNLDASGIACWNVGQFYKVQIRFDLGEDGYNPCTYFNINSLTTGKNSVSSVDIKSLRQYLTKYTANFSEWSSVCLLRPIPHPGIYSSASKMTSTTEWVSGLKGFKVINGTSEDDIEQYPSYVPGEILISGGLYFSDYKGTSYVATSETLNSYTLSILNDKKTKTLIKSETIYPDATNEFFTYFDISALTAGTTYTIYYLQISYTTTNGYTNQEYYPFIINNETDEAPFTITPTLDDENGIVSLKILQDDIDDTLKKPKIYSDGTHSEFFPGYLHIRRTSSKSNFTDWETMAIYTIGENDEPAFIDFVFEDKTVESLTGYIYSVQYENSNGYMYPPRRTDDAPVYSSSVTGYYIKDEDGNYYPITDETFGDVSQEDRYSLDHYSYNDIIMLNFNGPIFSRGDQQIRLIMDYSISNMTPTVNRAKFDTLGGKYPKFVENALLNYKQFSISGKISAQLDDGTLYSTTMKDIFECQLKYNEEVDDGNVLYANFSEYMSSQYPQYYTFINKQDTLGSKFLKFYYKTDTDGCYTRWDNWLPYYDWMWEREFRESLVAWLNDGEPKLYRSASEGNLAVILTDISLTPTEGTSRRLYDFSATMYEVGDGHAIDDLTSLGIYDYIDGKETKYTYSETNDTVEQTLERIMQLYNFSMSDEDVDNYGSDLVPYIANNITSAYNGNNNIFNNYSININSTSNPFCLRSVKIQFRNRPHIFIADTNNEYGYKAIDPKESSNDELKDSFYGYYVYAKFKDEDGYKIFFVNDTGYIQFPDNVNIVSLILPQMISSDNLDDKNTDYIDIQYVVNYVISEEENTTEIESIKYSQFVIGQISDNFKPGTDVSDLVYFKYQSASYDSDTGEKSYERYLNSWKGLSIETAPNTLINFTYNDKETSNSKDTITYEIGPSGVLNMSHFFPCKDLTIIGRKFYRQIDEKNAEFLSENQYYKDVSKIYGSKESITNPKQQWVYYIDTLGWYIYWNGEFYKFYQSQEIEELETDTALNTYISINNESTVNYLYWNDDAENALANIIEPSSIESYEDKYLLWYGNKWLNMSDLLIQLNEDSIVSKKPMVGIGFIPVDAIINYTGSVLRVNY